MIRQGVHSRRKLISAARELRRRQTNAEKVMWRVLRDRRFEGIKFRRQHQIEGFIVDFYCVELKLIVELDGKQHLEDNRYDRDVRRTEALQRMGMTIVRFENEHLMYNAKVALESLDWIIKKLRAPHPAR